MSAPMLRKVSKDVARAELAKLENSVDGGIRNFEERAHSYDLSPKERGVWEEISELRWLLDHA